MMTVMARQWRDLQLAKSDSESGGVVTAPEVKALIAPHQALLKSDQAYKASIARLAQGEGARLTPAAAKALGKLLGKQVRAGLPAHTFAPRVLNATYSPGQGARPLPGAFIGPRIGLKLQFNQTVVNPEWKVTVNNKTKVVTVYIKGTADRRVRHAVQPEPLNLSINVPRPKTLNADYLLRVVSTDDSSKVLFETTFNNRLPI